jgi:malate synthase
VSASLAYCGAWLGGNGCIPLNWLMEDAATAEITRVQLWQWVRYGSRLADTGETINASYIDKLVDEEAPRIKKLVPTIKDDHLGICAEYLKAQVRKEWPSEFLTSDFMPYLAANDGVDAKWHKSSL